MNRWTGPRRAGQAPPPCNHLVHRGDLVVVDLPQVVDVVATPRGAEIARRDVTVTCTWFTARCLVQDPDDVLAVLGRP